MTMWTRKSLEVLLAQDLCEKISNVVFCVNMHKAHNVLVPKSLHTFLPHVDVLELGLVSSVVDKDLSRRVVHL